MSSPPPSMYEEVLGLAICERLANGESLAKICRTKSMPGRTVIYKWARQFPEFAALLKQARLDQADSMADDILAIADDQKIDPNSRKIMVDARKWIASHLNVARYGDRQAIEHSGGVNVVLPEPGDEKL